MAGEDLTMQVCLLKGIGVQLGERYVEVGSGRDGQLLAAIALDRSGVGLPEPLSSGKYLQRLRDHVANGDRGLGRRLIQTNRGRRKLASDVGVDVLALHGRITALEGRLESGDQTVQVAELQDMLETGHAELVPGLEDLHAGDHFFSQLRADHEARMSGIFRKGIAWAQAKGNQSQARQWLQQWEVFGADDWDVSEVRRLLDENRPVDEAITTAFDKATSSSLPDDAASAVALRTQLQQRLRRAAPGSTRHTLKDLIDTDDIYVGVPWRELGKYGSDAENDLAEHITASLVGETGSHDMLVVAAPGSGKSILMLRIARLLIERSLPAIHVDLADHKHERAQSDFASAAWLSDKYGIDLVDADDPAPIVIADSLDEVLTGLAQHEINELLHRDLFVRANVVACRLSYFERYLSASPFAQARPQRFELQGLSPEQQNELAERYLSAAFPSDGPTLAQAVINWLDEDRTRRDICAFPLHLMLAVEAISPSRNQLTEISDLVGLWHRHVHQVLTTEAQRPGALLDATQSAAILETAAWHFYDEEGAGNADPPLFTMAELRELLNELPARGDIAAVADEIENRTLITTTPAPFVPEPSQMLRFTHRSLHTYLVARHLYHEVTDAEAPAPESFGKFLSGEVSRMLLEFISRLRGQPRLASRAVTNLSEIIASQGEHNDPVSAARERIARQQAGYYLGALGGPAARRVLTDALRDEQDLWVARGMAIGLSLAGDHDHLTAEIEQRRSERRSNGPTPRCDVNIGYHLSFAGDQPLDVLAPDRDQGEPSCALTVATLLRQLELPQKRGSWRSTLFTFTDLARHRPISIESFTDAVMRDHSRLTAALHRLESDPEAREWPELHEAAAIITEIADA
jgi:hypothetical protein